MRLGISLNVLLKEMRPHKISWCSLKPNLKKPWSYDKQNTQSNMLGLACKPNIINLKPYT